MINAKLIPIENTEAFQYLYCIEVGLREIIIESLQTLFGPLWYKERLPGDILLKYREGLKMEKSIHWSRLIPLHPIYYIDFPDLKKIIGRSDNWEEVFKSIFSNKSLLDSMLSELEPVRNRIAHNRKISSKDVENVKTIYNKMIEILGNKKLEILISQTTQAPDILQKLTELRKLVEKSVKRVMEYKKLENINQIEEIVIMPWWFHESYLGHSLDDVILYYKTIKNYFELPHHRGSGYKTESWVKSNALEVKYSNAVHCLSKIIKGMEGE